MLNDGPENTHPMQKEASAQQSSEEDSELDNQEKGISNGLLKKEKEIGQKEKVPRQLKDKYQ